MAVEDVSGESEFPRPTGDRRAAPAVAQLIAQLGHIGEAGCMQWLGAAPSSPERAHAAAWVGEFLSQPLTREAIDRMLDAIRSS
jgi:hypothetical protein